MKEKLAMFKNVFKGREDCYGAGGKRCIKQPLTDEIFLKHISSGEILIGTYPLLEDNTTYWIAIDFDRWEKSEIEKVIGNIKAHSITPYLEISKSKGHHIWIFFSSRIQAWKTRLVISRLINQVSGVMPELFPKQDSIPKGGYGNYINLPLFKPMADEGRTVFIDHENGWKPFTDQWKVLANIKKNDEAIFDSIINKYQLTKENNKQEAETPQDVGLPCIKNMLFGVTEGCRDKVAFLLAKHFLRSGMPKDIVFRLLTEWDSKNAPPLGSPAIKRKIKSASSKAYKGYDCDDPLIQQFCSKDCPVYLKNNPEEFEEPIDISQFVPMSLVELGKILGKTVKRDEENKLATFLCLLSAYTEDNQFNISFNAPSSTGKSFIPMEIAKLFPEKDVIAVGYCSPTAFFHDVGKYEEEIKGYRVELQRKNLIFLDQPHTLLLQHLRPLLSHDKKVIKVKITDKSQKAGLRTKTIYLVGYPSVIFCTANLKIDEQEATRFLLLSPETSQEKIREALNEKVNKESDRDKYEKVLASDPERQSLIERIKAIKREQVNQIIIPFPEKMEEVFLRNKCQLKPRHTRDVGRLASVIKGLALLNVWFRERDGSNIIATEQDLFDAVAILDPIIESQEYNLPPYVYGLFKEVIVPLWQRKQGENNVSGMVGLKRKEILAEHYKAYHRHLADWQFRQEILPMLYNSGLIFEETDPNDKRFNLIYLSEEFVAPPPNSLLPTVSDKEDGFNDLI